MIKLKTPTKTPTNQKLPNEQSSNNRPQRISADRTSADFVLFQNQLRGFARSLLIKQNAASLFSMEDRENDIMVDTYLNRICPKFDPNKATTDKSNAFFMSCIRSEVNSVKDYDNADYKNWKNKKKHETSEYYIEGFKNTKTMLENCGYQDGEDAIFAKNEAITRENTSAKIIVSLYGALEKAIESLSEPHRSIYKKSLEGENLEGSERVCKSTVIIPKMVKVICENYVHPAGAPKTAKEVINIFLNQQPFFVRSQEVVKREIEKSFESPNKSNNLRYNNKRKITL